MADTIAPQATSKTETTPAVDPKAKVEEATHVVKVNGQERKLTQAQLIAAAQKGLFADEKLNGVRDLQNKTSALIDKLKTPAGVLEVLRDKSLGNSPKEVLKAILSSQDIDEEDRESLSRWVYENVVVKGKMTPEQIEKENKLTEYERLKKQEDERKKKELTDAQSAKVQQIYQGVRAEVTKQIVADKTFPKTEECIRVVVDKLRVMNKEGLPLTTQNVTKALEFVKKSFLTHQQTILDAITDDEALISAIGEARALRISRALVSRFKKGQKVEQKSVEGTGDEPRKKITDIWDEKQGRHKSGYALKQL